MARITAEDLRWLLELIEEEALAEIEVHEGEEEILVRGTLGLPTSMVTLPRLEPTPTAHAGGGEPELNENQIPVLSPMAGVFYVAPSPGTAPFVEVGDHVEHGDTVGLVEAMKLFSEVPAPTSGTVVRFLVENEETVEADQCLMVIERSRH